ncbi:hypothetical protein PENTCL1PPCAC_29987, partial [Pristionchus entomophagus]
MQSQPATTEHAMLRVIREQSAVINKYSRQSNNWLGILFESMASIVKINVDERMSVQYRKEALKKFHDYVADKQFLDPAKNDPAFSTTLSFAKMFGAYMVLVNDRAAEGNNALSSPMQPPRGVFLSLDRSALASIVPSEFALGPMVTTMLHSDMERGRRRERRSRSMAAVKRTREGSAGPSTSREVMARTDTPLKKTMGTLKLVNSPKDNKKMAAKVKAGDSTKDSKMANGTAEAERKRAAGGADKRRSSESFALNSSMGEMPLMNKPNDSVSILNESGLEMESTDENELSHPMQHSRCVFLSLDRDALASIEPSEFSLGPMFSAAIERGRRRERRSKSMASVKRKREASAGPSTSTPRKVMALTDIPLQKT